MSQTIELESIRRLDIKPGETLVVTLPSRLTMHELEQARAQLQRYVPRGVKLLVVSDSVDLSVLCPSSHA